MLRRLLCLTLCLLSVYSVSWGNANNALALQQRLIEVYQQNQSAIVRVKAAYPEGESVDGSTQVTLRVGTGFFISKEGHVLVSASRAAGATRVWVEFKGKSYATEAVGHDRQTNISVLKVIDPPKDFTIIPIDTSVKHPALGSIAYAISCPLDFEPSPSMGIVTGMDKKLGNKVFPTEYIRTSISVDAGQGGCPVLDINGRFIGMTVASIPDLDASYCLPVDALARVRDDLMFSGQMIHSWMGFEVAEILNTDDTHAVYLSRVLDESPASTAGLEEGDHLVSIAGRLIDDVSDVPGAIFFTRANQFASISILRDGEPMDFSIKTLPRPDFAPKIELKEFSQATKSADEVVESGEATSIQ